MKTAEQFLHEIIALKREQLAKYPDNPAMRISLLESEKELAQHLQSGWGFSVYAPVKIVFDIFSSNRALTAGK